MVRIFCCRSVGGPGTIGRRPPNTPQADASVSTAQKATVNPTRCMESQNRGFQPLCILAARCFRREFVDRNENLQSPTGRGSALTLAPLRPCSDRAPVSVPALPDG